MAHSDTASDQEAVITSEAVSKGITRSRATQESGGSNPLTSQCIYE